MSLGSVIDPALMQKPRWVWGKISSGICLVAGQRLVGWCSSEAWPQISLPLPCLVTTSSNLNYHRSTHHFWPGQEPTSDEGFRLHCCNADYVECRWIKRCSWGGRRQSQDQFQHVWSSPCSEEKGEYVIHVQSCPQEKCEKSCPIFLGSAVIQLSGIWGFWQRLSWPPPPLTIHSALKGKLFSWIST